MAERRPMRNARFEACAAPDDVRCHADFAAKAITDFRMPRMRDLPTDPVTLFALIRGCRSRAATAGRGGDRRWERRESGYP